MKYFKEILKYASPYKLHISLNIFFNILYAFFSALSFVSMIPMLNILFGTTPKITKKPIYEGFSSLENYLSNKINYELNIVLDKNPLDALIISIFLILSLFFLKNLFNYLALFFITFLRNGILKDLRNGFRAFSYNLVARAFDISLKEKFDPKNSREDYFIEDILRKQGY